MNDNKSNNRTKTIKARLSESEYQAISEQRQASGLNESEFVRRALLGVRISGSGAGNQKAMVYRFGFGGAAESPGFGSQGGSGSFGAGLG